MNKEQGDRVLINTFLHYADVYYSMVKDNFVSAAKTVAKEKYGIELTHELEMLMKGAYESGFADALYLGVDRDDIDEGERGHGERDAK